MGLKRIYLSGVSGVDLGLYENLIADRINASSNLKITGLFAFALTKCWSIKLLNAKQRGVKRNVKQIAVKFAFTH